MKIIIIGATSGIGRGLAELYASKNITVGITGRRIELLEEIKNSNPKLFYIKCFDLQNTGSVEHNLNELAEEMQGLDILIISSGTGEVNENLSFDVENNILKTNINGFTCAADWGYNYFKKQGFGQIVGITSVAGLRGSRFATAYGATKSFQMKYLESLRQKSFHTKSNIIVTDIRPGFVDTAMAKSEHKFWVATVAKASKQIYKAISKKKDIAYVTKRWRYVAIIFRLIPNFIYKKF